MNIKYLPQNDLMYVYFASNVPNTQMRTTHEEIFKFVAKADKNKTVGFEIENASKNMKFIMTKLDLTRKQKLAICLHFIRESHGKTQKEFSDLLTISESTYKSIEKAEHNINFDTLDTILETFHTEPVLEDVFDRSG